MTALDVRRGALLPFVAASLALHLVVVMAYHWIQGTPHRERAVEVTLVTAPAGRAGGDPRPKRTSTPPASRRAAKRQPAGRRVPPKPRTKPKAKPRTAAKPKASAQPAKRRPTEQASVTRRTAAAKVHEEPRGAGDPLAEIRKLVEARARGKGSGVGEGPAYDLPAGIAARLYFREIEAAVRRAWQVPPGRHPRPVVLEIRIGPDGRLLASKILTSSGEPLLDRSALAALERATLPPPPTEFRTPLRLRLRLVPPEE